MLSVFPTMFLSLLAHALLRFFVGSVFLYLGFTRLSSKKAVSLETLKASWPRLGIFFLYYIAIIELVIGVMFIIGFLTQIAALIALFMSLKILLFKSRFDTPAFPSPIFYILMCGASISLLITGAGALAVDLPF